MKYFKSLAIAAMALTTSLSSCDMGDFGDINVDPNKPSTAYTSMLYTFSAQWVQNFAMNSSSYDPWTQMRTGYLSESKNNQYGGMTTTTTFGTSSYYAYYIKNLNTIIELNSNEETKNEVFVRAFGDNENQIAVAKTLRAFYFMMLTDILGPIPYSEAFKGESEGIWAPKFDSQEDIYAALDADLVAAYAQFDESSSLSSAELLYDGDISKWKKFNASLRMMMAIKMADVDPTNGKARFAKAYADGGMTEVEDGFHYTFDSTNPSYYAHMYYVGNANYAAANVNFVPNKIIVDMLKEYQDPRMFSYFTLDGYKGKVEGAANDFNAYKGVPFGGSTNDEVVSWAQGCASVNSTYCEPDATYGLITTSRTLLVEAQAAVLGWIDADASALYEAGIRASFGYQAAYHTDVTEIAGKTAVEDYIASVPLSSDKAEAIKQIVTQRFLAGFMCNGIEAWSDWRIHNIPTFTLTQSQIDEGNLDYPYRMNYSDTDKDYNVENAQAAMDQWLGGEDNRWARVWWDVANNNF
jgi:hypothetical protein